MKANENIYMAAVRLYKETVTLIMNVSNGCKSDFEKMQINKQRLVKAYAWCRDNEWGASLKNFASNASCFKGLGDEKFIAHELYLWMRKENGEEIGEMNFYYM